MRITKILVENILGARRARLTLTKPVTLFAGFNGAGKSSLQESVRMALCGDSMRVGLKKDFSKMVSDGAKTGVIDIDVADIYACRLTLPDGNREVTGDMPPALPFVLDAQRFAQLHPDDRRTFLFKLTGCTPSKESIRARLLENGCDSQKIEAAIPMLRADGFPAACEFASKKATEAKGAWRGVTGEAWGPKKAEGWQAQKSAVDQQALDTVTLDLATLDTQIAAAQQELGAVEQEYAAQKTREAEIAAAQATIDKLPRLQEKLKLDEDELAAMTAKLNAARARASTGPRIGLIHDIAEALDALANECQRIDSVDRPAYQSAVAAIARYEREHGKLADIGVADAVAKAALPPYIAATALLERTVANDKRDIANAAVAQALLDSVCNVMRITDDAIGQLRAAVKEKTAARDALRKHQDALHSAALAASVADEKTNNATTHHADVSAWLAIAAQLAPDGIPNELLAKALKPINLHLRSSASATGWMQVAIAPDMQITADGRDYHLLSKSEKWRCDAMIANAIAQLSNVRILMLDEVDILDLNGRIDLFTWIGQQADVGVLDTVLLFATMKGMPSGLPETIESFWMEEGEIVEFKQAA